MRIRQLAVSSLLALTAVAAAPAIADASCSGAKRTPAAQGLRHATHATLCLLNRERARHGLSRLHLSRKLSRAARGHARAMVHQHFFAHESLNGATFDARIKRTGWTRSRRSYTLGENIGWGGGSLATPRSMVRGWMASAGHRANILAGDFSAIGIGIANGAPSGGAGATYATDFGG
ncbi:MAG TPA: CAP domain-containing protein [Solirubrobacter sp.]|nr:CAP domain-containing protein [Solirubrobacter sp.]